MYARGAVSKLKPRAVLQNDEIIIISMVWLVIGSGFDVRTGKRKKNVIAVAK